MRKGLLGSTALIAATATMAGVAGAAEAPTWKLTGNMNFQFYYVSQDFNVSSTAKLGPVTFTAAGTTTATGIQDHAWYFGVDESELQLNVAGTADNGLNYGFKIELNANTTDTKMADEARLQLSGAWGTLQMGDEDGAEDIMNYGGENLMGATGGFDGDSGDVMLGLHYRYNGQEQQAAATAPTIAGDTSDATKVSYFSPRFSGFQVGASITPNPSLNGDNFKKDGAFENAYGLGANYDNAFGGLRVRASAVYAAASSNDPNINDISAYSVGGIVGFGPVSVGANYTDNGDSGSLNVGMTQTKSSSYWDVAASFEQGPIYLSAGYMSSTRTFVAIFGDSTRDVTSVTADYTVAPGLSTYAEVDLINDDVYGGGAGLSNSATLFIAGANVSF